MPDPTKDLPDWQAAQLRTLLDAVGDLDLSDGELGSLEWLSGWERHIVQGMAALLRRARLSTADLHAQMVAAGYDQDEPLPLGLADLEHFSEHGVLPGGETDA